MIISDIDAIKTLSDPLRMKMLSILQRLHLASATTLAEELQESAPKISYHLKQLEKHGIVYQAETRTKGNLIENLYAPSARQFSIQRDVSSDCEAGYDDAILSMVQEINAQVSRDLMYVAKLGQAKHFSSTISYDTYYLTLDEIEQLRTDILARLMTYADRKADDGHYACNLGFLLLDREQGEDKREA